MKEKEGPWRKQALLYPENLGVTQLDTKMDSGRFFKLPQLVI